MADSYSSWGNYPDAKQNIHRPNWRHKNLFPTSEKFKLPRGNGRSYGDSPLNDQGILVDIRQLNRFIRFDSEAGLLECEAGVLLGDILDLIEPKGWFLAVTPGTKFVTVAGAIANDVHGKNHHVRGCFSHHVESFELCRSDGSRLICSESENSLWYKATIGGLGLTGIISKVTLTLMQIKSTSINSESIRMQSLGDFFTINEDSNNDYEYTVAWVDCLARGKSQGRGLYMRGNHSNDPVRGIKTSGTSKLSIPVTLPFSAVNRLSLRVLNTLYYYKQWQPQVQTIQSRDAFFYPLDGILHWNRLYGHKGFLQYQCVIPNDHAPEAIAELLAKIAQAGTGSFLLVLKAFGDIPSKGLLSFARQGVTLAMDFPFRGEKTLQLLTQLDAVTANAGGAVYPAKDARMSGAHFKQWYANWQDFLQYKDPEISSSFWRRVMQ